MSHPLDGIWEKFRRAKELTDSLEEVIQAFAQSDEFWVDDAPGKKPTEHRLVVYGPPVPFRISVLAGEIIHHLRSVLDHMVRQLVLANGQQPKRQAFPVCECRKAFLEQKNGESLRGVCSAGVELIDSFQPYQVPGGFEWSLLWVLHRMDIEDKHRLLTVVTANAVVDHIGIDSSACSDDVNIMGLVTPKGRIRPTREGAEVFKLKLKTPSKALRTVAKPKISITFGPWGPVVGLAVVPFLRRSASRVEHIVVRLNKLIPRPKTERP